MTIKYYFVKKLNTIFLFFPRIESYSCKMIGSEKAAYKKFSSESGRGPHDLEALSPPQNGAAAGYYGSVGGGCSPGYSRSWSSGRSSDEDETAGLTLCDVISRKSLFYLISTLNAAFPDYDFSDAKGSEFSKEPSFTVSKLVMCLYWLCFNINSFCSTWLPTSTACFPSLPRTATPRSTTASGSR